MAVRSIRNAVVTGPTGAVGQALCRELLDRGARVYAICRSGSPRAASLPHTDGLRLISCDLGELDRLPERIPDGANAFFHLGWTHSVGPLRNDLPAQVRNIQYTLDAVKAAKALGCAVFVGAGSQAEYGRVNGPMKPDTPCFPENGYGMAKLCAGQMSRLECEKLGLDHIWLRILSVYGPYDRLTGIIPFVIGSLLRREKPALTPGGQLWDFLYSGDAAAALCLAAEKGRNGAVYPLGSGQPRTLRAYLEELRDAVDPALPLGFGDLPYPEGQVMHMTAEISAFARDTGFAPETAFSDGIIATIRWLEETST